MDLPLPTNTPEYMAPAYYGCLHWAIGSEDVRKKFEEATGSIFPALPRTGIEAMVDKACGIDREKELKDYIGKFKAWHDEFVWGDPMAPEPVE